MDVAQDAAAVPVEPGERRTGLEVATEAGRTDEEARGSGEAPADAEAPDQTEVPEAVSAPSQAEAATSPSRAEAAAAPSRAEAAAAPSRAEAAAAPSRAEAAAAPYQAEAAAAPSRAEAATAPSLPIEKSSKCKGDDRPPLDTDVASQGSPKKAADKDPPSALDKELEALLSGITEPSGPDILMIQSEHNGKVNLVKVEESTMEPTEAKAPPPALRPASTWTSVNIREFKHRMANEKHGVLTVKRGEVMTVRVPTHPEGKRLCWEFATEDYDIGFGIYFDWTPVTSTAVTIQVSDSSDDEEEETSESPWHSREGDVERGSVYRLRSRYGEIMQVLRRDSHREVQAGSHEYPGEGVYLLKLDNSYSLLRNKTLYFHVYYSS
ncbi:protein TMED8 [Gastrophryne carolinensis]